MAMDSITRRMFAGEKEAIIEGFISSSYIDNANAIVQATLHEMKNKAVETQLQRLRNDETCIFGHNAGYRISHFAIAALHLLGIDEYSGTEKYILDLIASKFDFFIED